MSDLIAAVYQDVNRAAEVMAALQRFREEYSIGSGDVCVVSNDARGGVQIRYSFGLAAAGGNDGELSGGLLGTLLFRSLLVDYLGMSAGRTRATRGMDGGVISRLSVELEPGTSAILLLVRKTTPDEILSQVRRFGGQVLYAALTAGEETYVEAALHRTAPGSANRLASDSTVPDLIDMEDNPQDVGKFTCSTIPGEFIR
ncbi:MAG: DUF1269 domain-containing protein [Fibrella sp.]|nr:DUF1269 domain-containing protein [Armatimonadota bacterium]